MLMDEQSLIEPVLKVIELEVGPLTQVARVEVAKAVWNAIDQAEQARVDPWGDD